MTFPSGLWHDLRIACRSLAKQPVFSLVIVGILAIGVAGMTAIFSLFNGLLLRPFPVPNEQRLVELHEADFQTGTRNVGVWYSSFDIWRQHNQTFACMGFCSWWDSNLSVGDKPERVGIRLATHDVLEVLGVRPVLGRYFTKEEDRPGGPNVILISSGLWERRFGKDPAVLGRTLRLDGDPFTIIGVLPPEADFPEPRDIWQPLRAEADGRHGGLGMFAVGLLREGVTGDIINAGMDQPPWPTVYLPTNADVPFGMFGIVRVSDEGSHRRNRAGGDPDPLSLMGPIREIIRSADPDLPVQSVQTLSQRLRDCTWLRRLAAWLFGIPAAAAAIMAFVGIYGVISYSVSRRVQEIGIRAALGASRLDIIRMVVGQALRLILIGLVFGGAGGFILGRVFASLPGMLYRVSPNDPVTFLAVALLLTGVVLPACYLPARRAARVDPMVALRCE